MIDEVEEAQAQARRNAEYQRLKAESAPLMDEVDRILSERRDPNDPAVYETLIRENVIPLLRKPKPSPPEPDPIITEMIEAVRAETANQLGALREEITADLNEIEQYVAGELSTLLTTVFNNIADEFSDVRLDVKSLQAKYVEGDIANLQFEVASLRADLSSLQNIVGNLSGQIAQIANDLASIERSGAGKIVALR